MNATVLNRFSHQFSPQGVSVVFSLAESHITIHTFPEFGSATLDCHTCGHMDSKVGVKVILDFIQPSRIHMEEISRDKEKEAR